MKPNKAKKQRPNVHITFDFSDDTVTALSNALLFLLSLKDFSFEDEKISYDSASEAANKLLVHETELTRGEVRAAAKAVDIVLLRIPDNANLYGYIDEEFTGIISRLEHDLPILRKLQAVLAEAVKELRKLK